jgi:centriolar protein POC1
MYLASSSQDATLKIWDLRQGQLLYTLYGHEGSTTAVTYSQQGDYFASGGVDNMVMVWRSNIDASSELEKKSSTTTTNKRITQTKPAVQTDVRPPSAKDTPKERIPARAKSPKRKENEPPAEGLGFLQTGSDFQKQPEGIPEEFALTLDNIVNQLDMVTKTLVLLEQRVSRFEDHVKFLSEHVQSKTEGRSLHDSFGVESGV